MRRIGLLTDVASQHLDEDLPPLVAALVAQGAAADVVAWDEPDPDLMVDELDLVVVRSPWEYHHHAERYLAYVEHVARTTPVLNRPELLRWNIDKRYVQDLADTGVPVVATHFIPPGMAVPSEGFGELVGGAATIVVKPTVSAGSKNTARFRVDDTAGATALIASLHAQGKTAMLQPYLDRVDDEGETALIYVDGEFSHGLRKGPLLSVGAPLVEGTFAVEEMSVRVPQRDEQLIGEAVLSVVRERFGVPLYARVDVVREPSGRAVLLEAELNEPSLFHLHAPGSAERFASAILARVGQGG